MSVVNDSVWFVGGLIVAFGSDWLFCTRLAAYYSTYDYAYQPGMGRSLLLAVIVGFLVYVFETNDPSPPWLPGIAIATVAFLVYGQLAARDVRARLVPSDQSESKP